MTLRSVSDIMRSLHHTIANEIEVAREGLTPNEEFVILDGSVSVSALPETETGSGHAAQLKLLFDEGDPQ